MYYAFISYSHRDKRWADWLHRGLETYRVPQRLVGRDAPIGSIPRRLTPIFKDRDELASASNLGDKIQSALRDSEFLIVVCSAAAAESKWVNEEIRYFRSLGKADRILCLLVEEPSAANPVFAPALLTDEGVEPLAADARPEGDDKRGAKLKLVAGMLGVSFDDLNQRELQRRQRNLTVISAASLVGVVVMSALTTFALLARNEAEEQRQRAEMEAESARQTADFLVELFQVADPSEARGRTITAAEILARGESRIRSNLASQPSVRARLMRVMGEVYTGLGLYATAENMLREVRGLDDVVPQDDQLENRVALGEVLFLLGKYDEAEEVLSPVVEQVLRDNQWSQLATDAINGLADALSESNRVEEAIALYQQALSRDLLRFGADSAAVGRTKNSLGNALLSVGRMAEAGQMFEQSLAAYRASLPVNHPKIAEGITNLGFYFYYSGNRRAAAESFAEALPLYYQIYGRQHPEAASVQNNLGRIKLELREFDDAIDLFEEVIATDESAGKAEHRDSIYAVNSLALAYKGQGQLEKARDLFDKSLRLAELHAHPLRAPVAGSLAETLCQMGQTSKGLALATETRNKFKQPLNEINWHPAILDSQWALCHTYSGSSENSLETLQSAFERVDKEWGKSHLHTQDALMRLISGAAHIGDQETANRYRALLVATRKEND